MSAVQPSTSQPVGLKRPTIGLVLLVALVVGLFTVVWLQVYSKLEALIWEHEFIYTHRWIIPLVTIFFSLLVGLVRKYMRAPSMLHDDVMEQVESGHIDYTNFWGALLSSLLSLFSGVSLGPEAPLGFLSVDIAAWIADKLKVARESQAGLWLAGMSSTFNGIVGNPVFATLFTFEGSGGEGGLAFLSTNLAAGALGYLMFALLKIPPFAGFLNLGQINSLNLAEVAWAVVLGIISAALALFISASFKIVGQLMDIFKGRPVLRALAGGAITGIVCGFIPELLFSGEKTIHAIIATPENYGVALLIGMALLKVVLLAVAFKSGYMGGPTFPAMFAATMIAMALYLLFPGVPLPLLVACAQAGVVALVLKAPLTAILLVSVVSVANTYLLGLIAVSAATSIIAGNALQQLVAQRRA
jgi:H+/Cl- antiporter ClcA